MMQVRRDARNRFVSEQPDTCQNWVKQAVFKHMCDNPNAPRKIIVNLCASQT